MTTVYLLLAILANGNNITVETYIYSDAAKCLRNRDYNRKHLQGKYDTISIECYTKEVIKNGK